MKGRAGFALSLAVLVAAALAATAGAGSSATQAPAAAQAASCKGTIKIAIITPLTGDAGFLGQEQLSWAKLAVKRVAPQLGLKVQLLAGDQQLDNALAASLAQKYLADSRVMAVLGPATSGAALATTNTFFAAKMATVNMSATNVTLTKGGSAKKGSPSFFRVVPDDSVQGPTDARYMVDKLGAKKVVIVDVREPYTVGLANAAQATLRKAGVTTIRESVSIDQSDFSSLVTKIPGDTDVVFFPTQQPPKAQTFAQPADGPGIVIPVPDSGVPAAVGYAEASGLPFEMGLIRSHYVGRTFIEPQESIRHFGVRLKLHPNRAVLEGKHVVVVDDSIVRGTTSRKIVKMIREAGAKSVHVRISSPPVRWPCYYGINTPTRSELIAATHTEEEIARYLEADDLGYLSLWDGFGRIGTAEARAALVELTRSPNQGIANVARNTLARFVLR